MISLSTPNEAATSDTVTFTSWNVNTNANATGSSFWKKEKQGMPLALIKEFATAKVIMKMVIKIMLMIFVGLFNRDVVIGALSIDRL
mmetsp:Transcript_30220/g.46348  ORF Transcript_30220/g.46348 Transcript_30220/m.46348 type:complete len:87 (-) Transcript_30220:15-275(-)